MDIETWIIEADIPSMQKAMESGEISSEDLVIAYMERIRKWDTKINSILEINPEAVEIAKALDRERKVNGARGLLHGIPVLLKDNIDTHDKMHTSAGSISLQNSIAVEDSIVAARLRAAGAVLLGKTNMTEWANFMSNEMWAGYSSRGGLVLNPYGPGELFIGGSSSGSAASVAANLGAAAIGTETTGSIICPSSQNGVVGIKPTVGLVSQSGIIPITFSQDTAGPIARTVTDAAIILGTMVHSDDSDEQGTDSLGINHGYQDYTQFLDRRFLKQARIGIPRFYYEGLDEERIKIVEDAIAVLKSEGATIVDPVSLPCEKTEWDANVLRYEFKYALNNYLARLPEDVPVHSLEEIIAFNEQHAERALKYGQGTLIWSEETSGTLKEQEYLHSLMQNTEMARKNGIDYALKEHRLNALMFLGSDWGADLAARAGYPIITIPGGYATKGVIAPEGYTTKGPQGISFVGTAFSEPILIKIAFGFEQATKHRFPPELN